MTLDGLVKNLYKFSLPLLTTAVISGCSARAEPGYNPTPAPIVRETPTPTYPTTITPTPEVTQAPIPTPLVTPAPVVTPRPTPVTTPTPVFEPFKLYAPTATKEESDIFYKILEDDYNKVVEVYGIKVDKQLKVFISADKRSYVVGFGRQDESDESINNLILSLADKGSLGLGISDFTLDPTDRGLKHEMAHAFNDELFPTYHSWFDEGLAMYASGEVGTVLNDGRFDRDVQKLKVDSKGYWNNYKGAVAGHIIGTLYFGFLARDFNMTPEQNRIALSLLRKRYLESGSELTKADIEHAYETVLGVSIDPIFDSLRTGVMILYSTDPKVAGIEGYKINQRIINEF